MSTPPHSQPLLHTTLARYAQLGRRSDESLDQLVHIATAITNTRFGLVGLLGDDGSWFNGAIGMELGRAQAYFPFCGYALFRNAPFEIEDLRSEPRFAGDRHVTSEPGLRLFAGATLHGRSGGPIGALCLFDTAPRALSGPEREGLAAMARQIESQLQLRKELDKLRERHAEQLDRIQMLEGVLRAADRFAILYTDVEGTIRTFNQGAERMLGWSAADVIGRLSPVEFHDPRELAQWTAEVSATSGRRATAFEALTSRARAGAADERSATWRRKDGSAFPVAVMVAAARSEEEELTGFVVIAQDVTERKAAERMKDEFISVVSHELRTPLTAIRGSLGLVTGGAIGPVSAPVRDILAIAHSNTVRMVTLVNDILDVAKIESGTFEFRTSACDVRDLCERAVSVNGAFADQYGVRLVIDGPLPAARVLADADRVVQVLTNLVSNACKFSPRGETVHLAVAAVSDDDGPAVRLSVRDHGAGIPAEFRPYIFQRFMQADSSDHRQKGGTGLGLSIVRSIVEHHGGKVGFETEAGAGTTFWFTLRPAG